MVIHIEFIKKDNVSITNDDIIKNMNYIDDLLKENNDVCIMNNMLNNIIKYKNYFIILCIFIIILILLKKYIKKLY